MQCYSDRFGIEFNKNPNPGRVCTFDSLDECISQYEEFVADCENCGCIPSPLWVYLGKPDGNEHKYGFPDYPDYIVRKHTTRNKVIAEKA